MKTFAEWMKANRKDVVLPEGSVSGAWFMEHCLPMIVECTNCQSTMCLPSAMIDDDGQVFCTTCVGE